MRSNGRIFLQVTPLTLNGKIEPAAAFATVATTGGGSYIDVRRRNGEQRQRGVAVAWMGSAVVPAASPVHRPLRRRR